jgi:hypothetical protein
MTFNGPGFPYTKFESEVYDLAPALNNKKQKATEVAFW